MDNKNGFILSTYVYMLLVFFLLLLTTMLAVMNNTKLLSNKLKEQSGNTSGLTDKDFSFILLGESDMILKKGDEYIEPGFKIQTSKKKDLTNIVSVIGNVDINSPNTYKLTYSATYNGITKKLTRNVHVLDDRISGYIVGLYEHRKDENGLRKDNTRDENIRYSGSNNVVKNYVEFGNTGEVWRIIGIFNVTTSNGIIEPLVKLVREDSIGNMSWDSSDSTVNSGYGVNQWGASTYEDGTTYEGADLMQLLNGYYIGNSITCTFCNSSGQETCSNSCNNTVTPINSTYKNMIETVKWNIGAWSETIFDEESGAISPVNLYNEERGTVNGKICSGTLEDESENTSCNDTVTRTTLWEGKIALPYMSDWGYASGEASCSKNLWSLVNDDYLCKTNNWMHYGTTYEEATWMFTPFADSNGAIYLSAVYGGGLDSDLGDASESLHVRPTTYLKSSVKVESGDGTKDNPYKLSI